MSREPGIDEDSIILSNGRKHPRSFEMVPQRSGLYAAKVSDRFTQMVASQAELKEALGDNPKNVRVELGYWLTSQGKFGKPRLLSKVKEQHGPSVVLS